MKTLIAAFVFLTLAQYASAKPKVKPQPHVHYVCMAVGSGGGASGGNHVEWDRGQTLKEAQDNAFHNCARSTGGYGCAVSDCHAEADSQGTFFNFGN